jgi:hypothetical protein
MRRAERLWRPRTDSGGTPCQREGSSCRRAVFAAILLLILLAGNHVTADAAEIWLAPADAATSAHTGVTDFDAIFSDDWDHDRVRKSISVVKFYPSYLATTPDAKLEATFQFLKNHNIRVAFEGSMLVPQALCGNQYAEGGGQWTIDILQRMKALGLVIDYLAMNEPFLHAFRIHQMICSGSVADMAATNMATAVSKARALFPSIVIGDIEPVAGDDRMQPYMAALLEWISTYQRHFRRTLAFVHADIDSNRPHSIDGVAQAAKMLGRTDTRFGIIYNRKATDSSAQIRVAQGVEHRKAYERAGIRPSQMIFQSREPSPRHSSPSTALNRSKDSWPRVSEYVRHSAWSFVTCAI